MKNWRSVKNRLNDQNFNYNALYVVHRSLCSDGETHISELVTLTKNLPNFNVLPHKAEIFMKY